MASPAARCVPPWAFTTDLAGSRDDHGSIRGPGCALQAADEEAQSFNQNVWRAPAPHSPSGPRSEWGGDTL